MIFLANGGTLSELELRVLYVQGVPKNDPMFRVPFQAPSPCNETLRGDKIWR